MLVGTLNDAGSDDGGTSGNGNDDMWTTFHRATPTRQTTVDGFPLVHVDYGRRAPAPAGCTGSRRSNAFVHP